MSGPVARLSCLANLRCRRSTSNMVAKPKIADVSIIKSSGVSPASIETTVPASADNAAPPPIIIALPNPDAVPARCGRTDSMPAVALGIVRPLPRPTKYIKPKKDKTEPFLEALTMQSRKQ